MSILRNLLRFIALLVSKVVTRNNKHNYLWVITFLAIVDVLRRYKIPHFLFSPYMHCLKIPFPKHYSSNKDIFKEILKPPNASLPYFQRSINTVVYYFTQSGGSDDDSSEESGNEENKKISDPETEKPSDGATCRTEPSDSSSAPQKRKAETELEDSTKRSKSTASPSHLESKSEKGRNLYLGHSGSDTKEDKQLTPFSRYDTSADISQFFREKVDSFTQGGIQESLATSHSRLIRESQDLNRRVSSETTSQEEFVGPFGTLPKRRFSSDDTADISEEGESYSHKKLRSSNLCMPEDESHSISSRTEEDENKIVSQDTDNKVQQVPVPEGEKNETEIPQEGIVASSIATEERAERSDRDRNQVDVDRIPNVSNFMASCRKIITEEEKEFRRRLRKRLKSATSEESGSSERPGCSSDKCYDEPDSSPESTQNYRTYPGFSLQPQSVKKDVNYQKKFYKDKNEIVLKIRVRKIIERANVEASEYTAPDVPTIPDSDEELPSNAYHVIVQELARMFEEAYDAFKKAYKERKQNKELGKTGYTKSSFQEESPPSDLQDDDNESLNLQESLKSASSVAPLSKPPSEAHLTEANVSPIKTEEISSETGKAGDFTSSLQTEKSEEKQHPLEIINTSEGDLLTSGRTGARPKTLNSSSNPADQPAIGKTIEECKNWPVNLKEGSSRGTADREKESQEFLSQAEIYEVIDAENRSWLQNEECAVDLQRAILESIQSSSETVKERVSTEMSRDDHQGGIRDSFQVSSTDEENLKGACKNEQTAISNYEKDEGDTIHKHKILKVPSAEETFTGRMESEKKNLEEFGSEEILSPSRSLTSDGSSHESGNESCAEPATHFESTVDSSSSSASSPVIAGAEGEHMEGGSQSSNEEIQNVGSSNDGTDSESPETELEQQSPDEES